MYCHQIHELEQFCSMLGMYDSSGPCVLSVPRYGVLYGENVDLSELAEAQDNLPASDERGWLLPLLYDYDEHRDRTTVVIIRRQHPEYEILKDKSTLAHEVHHMLNVCSSSIGFQSHLGQMLLNHEFRSLFQELGSSGNAVIQSIGIPLMGNYRTESIPRKAQKSVRHFVETFAAPFSVFEREVYGRLRTTYADMGRLDRAYPAIAEEMRCWHRRVGSYAGFDGHSILDNLTIENVAPPIAASTTAEHCALLSS